MNQAVLEEQKFDVDGNVKVSFLSVEDRYMAWEGVASVLIATAIYTSPDVIGYNIHTIVPSVATVKVQASIDGITFFDINVELASTGAKAATIAVGDIGILRGKYKAVLVRPNADASSADAIGSHGNE